MVKIPKYFKYNVLVIAELATSLANKRADTLTIIVNNNSFCIPIFAKDNIIHSFLTTLTEQLTGLGLSIAYYIVKHHNYTTILESQESQSHFIYF